MLDTLNRLRNIVSGCCVTILVNTHRTKPDNLQDPIQLKNLIKEAESRLETECSKETGQAVAAKLKDLVDTIDHNYNLESLVLFVNEDMAEFARLTVPVKNRVVIHSTFATRDLLRAYHEQEHYLVLALSRDAARLIEAADDKVVQEYGDPFPIQNTVQLTDDRTDYDRDRDADNMIEEFFNRIDKAVQQVRATNPLPVVLCSEERNHSHYMKVADKPGTVVGHMNRNRMEEKAHHIVTEAWPVIHGVNRQANKQRLEELRNGVGNGRFLSDVNDIWRAINEGRGQTLFVQKGLIQPGRITSNGIEVYHTVPEGADKEIGLVDDVVDEIIELQTRFGGDAVFLSNGDLESFQGMALVTRY